MALTTKTNSMVLCPAVIITIIASCILSADAIRCHQCNSHLDEDCVGLRLVTPRAPLDKQFLKDCNPDEAFCRKTVTKIEVTGEQRIVRGCGKIDDNLAQRKNYCFDADNEGYQQTICSCFDDACNAAPPALLAPNGDRMTTLSVTGLCVLLAALLQRGA